MEFEFGKALQLLKAGKRVFRCGWNGKGMYIFLVTADSYSVRVDNIPFLMLDQMPFIAMKTADNKMVPWLASQTDILSFDWRELE